MDNEAATQTDFFPAKEDSAALEKLEKALDEAGYWRTAARIQDMTGMSDREIRRLDQLSDGRIITGNRGYRLISSATMEDVNECVGRLRHQANKMLGRVIQIERRYHARRSA